MTSVKALTSVAHGRHTIDEGQTYHDLPADVVQTLIEMGFAEAYTAPTGVTDSQDDLADLVGGEKAEADPQNKMEKAPKNKAK